VTFQLAEDLRQCHRKGGRAQDTEQQVEQRPRQKLAKAELDLEPTRGGTSCAVFCAGQKF
jgi:hypothetical protein